MQDAAVYPSLQQDGLVYDEEATRARQEALNDGVEVYYVERDGARDVFYHRNGAWYDATSDAGQPRRINEAILRRRVSGGIANVDAELERSLNRSRNPQERPRGAFRAAVDVTGRMAANAAQGAYRSVFQPGSRIPGVREQAWEVPPGNAAESTINGIRMGTAGFLNPAMEARIDMIRNLYPDAEFKVDTELAAERGHELPEWHQPTVVFRYQPDSDWLYINPPGVDSTDILNFASEETKMIPAYMLSGGGGLIGRVTRTGGLTAATDYASDSAAEHLLGAGEADMADSAATGGLHAGGRLLVGEPLEWAGRSLGRRPAGPSPAPVVDEAVNLPAVPTPEEVTTAAARQRLADAERYGIRTTQGQTTRNPGQLREEATLASGSRGQAAANEINPTLQAQRDGVEPAAQRIIGSNSGRTVDEAGEVAKQELVAARDALRSRVDEAYQTARVQARETGAGVSREAADALDAVIAQRLRAASDEGRDLFFDADAPVSRRAMQRIRQFIAQTRNDGMSMTQVERMRSRLRSLADDAAPADRRGVLELKGALDEWVDEVVERGLTTGDPGVVDLFRQARSLRTQFRELFEKGGRHDLGGSVVQRVVNQEMGGEQFINMVLAAGRVGAKRDAVASLRRLREIYSSGARGLDPRQLAMKSEGFQALREATLRRVFQTSVNQGDQYVPKRVMQNLDDLLDQPSLTRELFNAAEIAELRRFSGFLRNLSYDGFVNRSGTAYTLMTAARNAGGALNWLTGGGNGSALAGFLSRIPLLSDMVGGAIDFASRRAKDAVSNPIPGSRAPITQATSGTLASQIKPENRRP